jgi:hypothetical protein
VHPHPALHGVVPGRTVILPTELEWNLPSR